MPVAAVILLIACMVCTTALFALTMMSARTDDNDGRGPQ
jgi:hypothetical protein